jgi:hypothetical protein
MNPSAIEIEIQALILDGVAVESPQQLQAALSKQLGRLLTDQVPAGLASGGSIARLDGGAFSLAPGQTPEGTGTSIAQAVFHSLGGQA